MKMGVFWNSAAKIIHLMQPEGRWQRGMSLAPITPNYELCIMNYELKITQP